MAILTKEELLNTIKNRIGEDVSDEAIKFIEDVTDTVNDYETKINGDGTDWKKKYEENDADWRKKYRDRFFDPQSDDGNNPLKDEKEEEKKPITSYDELFTEEGGKK